MGTELRRYEDDIVRIEEEASVIRRETQILRAEIENRAIREESNIHALADSYVERLASDIEAYKQEAEINGTTQYITALSGKFPTASVSELMELLSTLQYMEEVSNIGTS